VLRGRRPAKIPRWRITSVDQLWKNREHPGPNSAPLESVPTKAVLHGDLSGPPPLSTPVLGVGQQPEIKEPQIYDQIRNETLLPNTRRTNSKDG